MNPMPGIICAATRVWSPGYARQLIGEYSEHGRAEADEQIGAQAGGPMSQLALEADRAAQQRGNQEAMIVEDTTVPNSDRRHGRCVRTQALVAENRSELSVHREIRLLRFSRDKLTGIVTRGQRRHRGRS